MTQPQRVQLSNHKVIQKSDIPPTIRVRENQRRLRARRKELIEDLQQRLREYEDREIQKTISVQIAARHVAIENAKLRELLISKGVSSQEIYEHLRRPNGAASTPLINTTLDPTTHDFVNRHQIDQGDHDFHMLNNQISHPLHEQPARPVPMHAECWRMDNAFMMNATATKNQELPNTALDVDLHRRNDDMKLEMSCEAAASIIAGMRGNGDKEGARRDLGCAGNKYCNVRNIEVFQVMDRG